MLYVMVVNMHAPLYSSAGMYLHDREFLNTILGSAAFSYIFLSTQFLTLFSSSFENLVRASLTVKGME